jgi:hypothetical protein
LQTAGSDLDVAVRLVSLSSRECEPRDRAAPPHSATPPGTQILHNRPRHASENTPMRRGPARSRGSAGLKTCRERCGMCRAEALLHTWVSVDWARRQRADLIEIAASAGRRGGSGSGDGRTLRGRRGFGIRLGRGVGRDHLGHHPLADLDSLLDERKIDCRRPALARKLLDSLLHLQNECRPRRPLHSACQLQRLLCRSGRLHYGTISLLLIDCADARLRCAGT